MQLAPLTHSNESSQSPRSLSSDPTVATLPHQQHEIMVAEGSSEPPGVTKPKPHQCQICGRGFTTGGHLQRHQRIHTGVKAFKCPYPGCETRTSRQDNLQQHYRTHLSPSIRRGSGSAARAAVARAMEEAGIRPAAGSRQRKAKSTTASSSSSSTHAPSAATQSLYGGSGNSTPSYGSGAYSAYEPLSAAAQGHPNYQSYPLHHAQSVSGFATPSSASSSRVPSPAPNGHPVNGVSHHPPYFPSAYPQNPYSYSQPTNIYYAQPPQSSYAQAQAQNRLYAPAGIPPHHQPVYSPINPSSFDSRHTPYANVLPPGYGGYPSRPGPGAQTPQTTDSRQSSIAPSAGDEPQNAAQAYSYHVQRQHSTSSLHSDYQRGAASTQSPPTSRRMSPPQSGTSGVVDPTSVAARTNPVLPAPVTAPGYHSYLQQQQHVAAQRAFSDSYTQLARPYDDRFAPAPPGGGARPHEEEVSNSGSEGSAPARQAPAHAYAQPAEHRYPTSPVMSMQDKPPLASHVKEIVSAEWAGDRRVW